MVRKKGKWSRHRRAAAALAALLALAAAAFGAWRLLAAGGDERARAHLGRPAQRHLVAVDAGHGGADSGAVGLVAEVQITQATTEALLQLLEADGAYAALRVHPDEEKPTPGQRMETARAAGAQLFVSLHANRDSLAASNGFECFAVPPGHVWHEESLRLAQAVCARMAAGGARLRGGDGVRYLYYRHGAKMMKESADTTVYGYPTFGVLQNAACPAVLIEQCFITNAADVAAWGGVEGCRAAAWCYYLAICDYFGTQPLVAPPAQWGAGPLACG